MGLHGVALVDKPQGLTSFAVVAQLRRVYRSLGVTRAGHTGTLDPLASGLLPICLGEATRYAQRLLDARKGYRARIKFGTSTTTLDREGDVVETGRSAVTAAELEGVLPRFLGVIEQVPPAFSALKIGGRPAYELARQKADVQLAPRKVSIYRLDLVAVDPAEGTCDLDVECSKGTYVRSLAADVAAAVGTVGHLAELRRTMTGGFRLDEARPLEHWVAATELERRAWLFPTDRLLGDLPSITLGRPEADALLNGRRVLLSGRWGEGSFRIYGPGEAFLGLGEVTGGRLRAQRLLPTG